MFEFLTPQPGDAFDHAAPLIRHRHNVADLERLIGLEGDIPGKKIAEGVLLGTRPTTIPRIAEPVNSGPESEALDIEIWKIMKNETICSNDNRENGY